MVILSACAPLPSVDPAEEYDRAVRVLGLNPVYPPRQNFRVGDVYLVPTGSGRPRDRFLLGHLSKVERYAADWDRQSLPVFVRREVASGTFSDSVSMMPVAFPSVTVSAASAAALGGGVPGGSGALGFGRARMVTIGFANTREFGLPGGMRPPRSVYNMELHNVLWAEGGFCRDRGEQEKYLGPRDEGAIGPRSDYMLLVITHIIVSDKITYTYNDSMAARVASSVPSRSVDGIVPPEVNLSIQIDGSTSPETLGALSAAVSPIAVGKNDRVGAGLASANGTLVTFSQNLGGYVAIAYDSTEISGNVCEEEGRR